MFETGLLTGNNLIVWISLSYQSRHLEKEVPAVEGTSYLQVIKKSVILNLVIHIDDNNVIKLDKYQFSAPGIYKKSLYKKDIMLRKPMCLQAVNIPWVSFQKYTPPLKRNINPQILLLLDNGTKADFFGRATLAMDLDYDDN